MFFVLLFILTILFNRPILASDNIFGLHLTQPQDIHTAHSIINSSNGDWGWTTIVIRTDQLDHQTWQDFFDNCRKYHIIPIIRLSTISDNGNWKRPSFSDIDNIANFLGSLNWPTRQKHIILFNEINHGQEWGGAVDVKNYVDVSVYAVQKFKSINPDFVILGGALDLASPENPPEFKSAANVYNEIANYNKEYFKIIDGLASHSYPNHGFVGTPNDNGQHSIRGYQWELSFINNFDIGKTLPVYITETGWPHREGESTKNQFYTTKTTAEFLKDALNIWGKDPNVQAVTPFIYNYPNAPFDHFSWLDQSEKMYPEYQRLIDMVKNKNKPEQVTKYEIFKMYLPFIILNDNEYTGQIILKNTGESIWGGDETNFCLDPQTTPNIMLDKICTDDSLTYPGQQKTFNFQFKIIKTDDHSGKSFISWTNLPAFEIAPFNKNATIYHPKITFWDKLLGMYHSYLNKLISK
jgi:hypothetical protein